MSEYQLSNLHVVTHEVTGAARSVWLGAQWSKRSLNAVWGGTRLSDTRGPVRHFFMRLGYVFYQIYSPPTLYLFFKRQSALQDGDTECQKASLGRHSIHLMPMLITTPRHPFQICKRSKLIPRQY